MLIRTFLVVLTLAMVLQAVPGEAKNDRTRWWKRPQTAERLELSQEMVQRLDAIYMEYQRSLIDLKAEVEKERFTLDTLMEEEEMNETEVMKQHAKVEHARSILSTERFKYFLQIRKIVGMERYKKLRSFYKKAREKRKAQK